MWSPLEVESTSSNDRLDEQESNKAGTEKKARANVGDLERRFILQCYNLSMGKDWKHVLLFTKERILDAELPQRVVQIYMDSPQDRVINCMKNIVKKALSSPLPSTSTSASSKPIYVEEQTEIQENLMTYASKGTPAHRKLQNKLRKDFTASSTDSDSEARLEQSKKKIKSDREVARQAQEAHKDLCTKAMDTLERVNSLLVSVDNQIKKTNQDKPV